MPAWYTTLRRVGYPTDVVLIDFESYFDAEYCMYKASGDKGLSTIEYVTDPRFEEVGKSVVHVTQPFGPSEARFFRGDDPSYIEFLQREYGPDLAGCTVVAQNFAYDGTVLARRYGFTPKYPIDLLGVARYLHPGTANDLLALTERYGLLRKGDTGQFKGLHLNPKWDKTPGQIPKLIHRGMTPEELASMDAYCCHDGNSEWSLFCRMLPRVTNTLTELRLMKHTLELLWKPTLMVDRGMGEEIRAKMLGKVDEAIAATGFTKDEISGNKSFSALLGIALDRAGDNVARFQKENKRGDKILAIAKTDEELEGLVLHPSEEVRKLITARTSIKSWPNHANRVSRILNQALASGGTLPVPLKYYGAHTGRWAGGEKINLQNLGSRGDPLISSVRQIIMAPDGHVLVIVDASQIEARVLDWISEQNDPVWADPSRDPYCEFASQMSARTVLNTKKVKQVIKAVKAWHDRMRGMGKVGQLGCGYGMGWEKAMTYAENSYGVSMTRLEAERMVDTYRKSHPKVCKFWRVVEQKFKAAARYGESSEMARGLKFHKEPGDVTVITLPNGRQLRYQGVKVAIISGREQMYVMDGFQKNKRINMWGGFLTENIVQAISRDILGEAILACEDENMHVALHVHDESVEVIPAADGPKALARTIEIFNTTPAWATGCPLASEGKIAARYEK